MNANIKSLIRRVSPHAVLAAAISCGVALTTATAGEPIAEPLTRVVSFADLNTNGQAGAKALYGRLRTAARQVCAPHEGRLLTQQARWRECFNGAVERAVAEIDEPILTAYHMNRAVQDEKPVQVTKKQ